MKGWSRKTLVESLFDVREFRTEFHTKTLLGLVLSIEVNVPLTYSP